MIQCLKITFTMEPPKKTMYTIIQKKARELQLEGTVQLLEQKSFKIKICGTKEMMEEFIDHVHEALLKSSIDDIEIEPFIKDSDYRGIFRVIE